MILKIHGVIFEKRDLTAKQYDVTYVKVYQWVKNYLDLGKESLTDKRGKHKEELQLS